MTNTLAETAALLAGNDGQRLDTIEAVCLNLGAVAEENFDLTRFVFPDNSVIWLQAGIAWDVEDDPVELAVKFLKATPTEKADVWAFVLDDTASFASYEDMLNLGKLLAAGQWDAVSLWCADPVDDWWEGETPECYCDDQPHPSCPDPRH
jgi:hypothetical protein